MSLPYPLALPHLIGSVRTDVLEGTPDRMVPSLFSWEMGEMGQDTDTAETIEVGSKGTVYLMVREDTHTVDEVAAATMWDSLLPRIRQ